MHRAYQPITAANNKLLKKRWDQRSYDLHRSKVANSKSVIDNQPPDTYMHIHLKLKKLQVEEERLAVVERDNRILLEKMSWIMRTKGQVDNWNHYKQKSLNKCTRQRELLRVSHENQVSNFLKIGFLAQVFLLPGLVPIQTLIYSIFKIK